MVVKHVRAVMACDLLMTGLVLWSRPTLRSRPALQDCLRLDLHWRGLVGLRRARARGRARVRARARVRVRGWVRGWARVRCGLTGLGLGLVSLG